MAIRHFAMCAVIGTLSCAVHAENDNSFRIGLDYIDNRSRTTALESNGPAFLTPQPAGAEAGDATTLVLAYTRRLNEHWDLELVIGIPPKVEAQGTGTLAPFGVIGHVREASPNLFVIYNFGKMDDRFRPFVAAGINYTRFYDAESTASGNLALGGPTKISLTSSTGWAAKAGASYSLNERWSIVGAIAALKVESDMTILSGSIERKTTIDFRPVVYTIGAAYHF